MRPYPLLFKPIYKEALWGGARMKGLFGRELPHDKVAESWDISCRKNEMSVVDNGALAGERFIDIINGDPVSVLGSGIYTPDYTAFPLLAVIIDAMMDLSVQVHPGCEYSIKHEGEPFGKDEMWYIAEAPQGASIILGLRDGVTREELDGALARSEVGGALSYLKVSKGDVINVPAGLVHAITAGILVFEIQNNVDVTYRMYDYGRLGADGKPRRLDIGKALDVIDYSGKLKKTAVPGLTVRESGYEATYYIANTSYAIERLRISGGAGMASDPGRFHILSCMAGGCSIVSAAGVTEAIAGNSVFIPAGLGEYTVNGRCELLKSYVPDIIKDFIDPLLKYGYTPDDIAASTDCSLGDLALQRGFF